MRKRSKRSTTAPPDQDDAGRAGTLRMPITRLGLSKGDVRRLNARGIRTLGDFARVRPSGAALRELESRSVETLRRALERAGGKRSHGRAGQKPTPRAPDLPPEVREAIARAKRASDRWTAARLARQRGPIPELERTREAPRLKAMLAMADATIKAFRAQQPWATPERVLAELEAYARAVEDLLGR